jgi:hypothetical protein
VFENPTRPLASPTATFIDVGNADDNGFERFCKDKVVPATASYPINVEGNTGEPWKARFIMSSAYSPPSPE